MHQGGIHYVMSGILLHTCLQYLYFFHTYNSPIQNTKAEYRRILVKLILKLMAFFEALGKEVPGSTHLAEIG